MHTDDSELWRAAVVGIETITQGRTNGHLRHLLYQHTDGNRIVIKVNGPTPERNWLNDRLRENFERELWRLTQRFYMVEFMLEIPTMQILPSAGERYGRWIEWPRARDMPVVAGCWKLSMDSCLSSGYTPDELARAMQMIGRLLPASVIRREWTELKRLEFIYAPTH